MTDTVIAAEDLTHGHLRHWLTVPLGLETRTLYATEIAFTIRETSLRVLITGLRRIDYYDLAAHAKVTVHDGQPEPAAPLPGQLDLWEAS